MKLNKDVEKRLEQLIESKSWIKSPRPIKEGYEYLFDFLAQEIANAKKEVAEEFQGIFRDENDNITENVYEIEARVNTKIDDIINQSEVKNEND